MSTDTKSDLDNSTDPSEGQHWVVRYPQPGEPANTVRLRCEQAASYVWGREDAGDKALQLALDAYLVDIDASWAFFCFAGQEAREYQDQKRTMLQPIKAQYQRFLALAVEQRIAKQPIG